MDSLNELLCYLEYKENIFLYGAGKIAEKLFFQLMQKNIFIKGFIVSGNDKTVFHNLPVYTLEEIKKKKELSSCHVILAIKDRKYELFKNLVDSKFGSIVFLNQKCILELQRLDLQRTYELYQTGYEIDFFQSNIENGMAILKEKETGHSLFRIFLYNRTGEADILAEYCCLPVFELEYGTLYVLEPKCKNWVKVDSTFVQLYVATSHLDKMPFTMMEDDIRIPIQVGAALTKVRKGCLTDVEGDSISNRNRDYCECTALYWIWKNTNGQGYVGLEHYRRRLKLDGQIVQAVIENCVDAVLALPQFCVKKVKDFFVDSLISSYDWDLMYQFVEEYDSSYKKILNKYEESWFYFSCNLCLFKREWFDQYCEFAFSVAFKIDDYYEQRRIIRQDRYMGYIFENLLSIFIMRHYEEMNIVCTEVEWFE